MNTNKTNPPLPISESDLISDMDKNGIGTDATIATHILTIQQRDYVTKLEVGNRFIPTKLGLALIEGYNEMGYQLNKPFLRASMEKDCQRIAKGELNKDIVVRNVLEQMKQCYETCFQEAYKLDLSVAKHFSKLGMNDANSYTIISRHLSACGKCDKKMNLRVKSEDLNEQGGRQGGQQGGPVGGQQGGPVGGRGNRRRRQGGGRGRNNNTNNNNNNINNNNNNNSNNNNNNSNNAQDDNDSDSDSNDDDDDVDGSAELGPNDHIPDNIPRHLYCSTCNEVHLLPPKGLLTAHTLRCLICNYQVLSVRNRDTNKEHTLCPSCFSNPPPAPLSDGIINDFRCMSCAHTACPLAGKMMGDDIDIVLCPESRCQHFMKLKKTKNGNYMLTCSSNDIRRCNSVWWLPKAAKTVIPQEEICEKCRNNSNGRFISKKLKVSFSLATAPPGVPPEVTVSSNFTKSSIIISSCSYITSISIIISIIIASNVISITTISTCYNCYCYCYYYH